MAVGVIIGGLQLGIGILNFFSNRSERARQNRAIAQQNIQNLAVSRLQNIRERSNLVRQQSKLQATIATQEVSLGEGITSSIAAGARASISAQVEGERAFIRKTEKIFGMDVESQLQSEIAELGKKKRDFSRRQGFDPRARKRLREIEVQLETLSEPGTLEARAKARSKERSA
jgi:hypothetical protein